MIVSRSIELILGVLSRRVLPLFWKEEIWKGGGGGGGNCLNFQGHTHIEVPFGIQALFASSFTNYKHSLITSIEKYMREQPW